MSFGFRIGAASDVGVKREVNEDSWGTLRELAVVADGMGGHRGGEVASAIAVDEVLERHVARDLVRLEQSVEQANKRILDEAALNPALHGMGTTVCAVAFVDTAEGLGVAVVNVGDSRVYRLVGRVLSQLSEDDSLVAALVREGRITAEEAELHPQRNIVTRALGVTEYLDVESEIFVPRLGDRYLLASDGLSDEVSALEIANLLAHDDDPQVVADALVDAANAAGGRDNITVVVVDIVAEDDAVLPSVSSSRGEPTMDVPEQGDRNRWSWRR